MNIVVKVKLSDIQVGWIDDSISFNYGEYAIRGANSYIFIDSNYLDKIKIKIVELPVQAVPDDVIMLIGNAEAREHGLPIRKQAGKNSIEENEE